MAAGRFELPDGQRVKVGSTRRYIVAAYVPAEERWTVAGRSDNRDTILARWREFCRANPTVPAHVVDTDAKLVIR